MFIACDFGKTIREFKPVLGFWRACCAAMDEAKTATSKE